MGFKTVAALDADVVVSIGKTDRKTGKKGPNQAEGYYLGNRITENKKGESKLHFLQTEAGNLGVWGTTDLDRKLSQVKVGAMVRITSTGTKPTPNGDMYTYKVEQDDSNVIEVAVTEAAAAADDNSNAEAYDDGDDSTETEVDDDAAQAQALAAAERAAKVQALLNKNRKTVNK